MPRIIPQKTKDRIETLFKEGLRIVDIAKRTGISPASVNGLTRLLEQYNPNTGKKFQKLSELVEYRITRMINPETGQPYKSAREYRMYCIRHPKKGRAFASERDYQKQKDKERSKRKENRALSKLIKTRLEELEKSQRWLAGEISVASITISKYAGGCYIPSEDKLAKIFKALEAPYKTLDDLLKDSN